jgi:homoserine kinase
VKNSVLANSTLGAGISGAGPSIFAWCKGQNSADKVAVSMSDAYLDKRISFDIHISKINDQGVKIL